MVKTVRSSQSNDLPVVMIRCRQVLQHGFGNVKDTSTGHVASEHALPLTKTLKGRGIKELTVSFTAYTEEDAN